jgi:hypothetical protein
MDEPDEFRKIGDTRLIVMKSVAAFVTDFCYFVLHLTGCKDFLKRNYFWRERLLITLIFFRKNYK